MSHPTLQLTTDYSPRSSHPETLDDKLGRQTYTRIVKAACVCSLVILLVAGLWPFHAPKNDVRWSENEDGLYFGRHGSVISVGLFPASQDKVSGTIEIWLQPGDIRGTHTILSFDGSSHRGVPFALRQINDALIVEQDNEDVNGHSWTAWSVVKGMFHEGQPVFATIILGPRRTSIYVNGVLNKNFVIGDSWNNFSGRLVVANSPKSSDSWSGALKGMAMYDRQLTQNEIQNHYTSWATNHRPDLQTEAPIALYLFNERAGRLIHNEFDHRTDLRIPSRYFVLHPAFLEYPWRNYHPDWSYWQDFIINVIGFVPFGFFATAHFGCVRQGKKVVGVTVLLGFLISLVIEALQALLPTRDSGMNDLITNTVGTAIGAMLYINLRQSTSFAARITPSS